MKLFQYFVEGNTTYMSVITISGLIMLYFAVYKIFRMIKRKEFDEAQLSYILLFGSLSFILGIFTQAAGLYQLLDVVSQAKDIPTSIIAGGLKLTFIAPIYGMILFVLSLVFWGVLKGINLNKV
jgi:hypothetical protein